MSALGAASRAVGRQRGLVVVALVATLGSAVGVMLLTEPEYEGRAVVTIDPADDATVARSVALAEGDVVRAGVQSLAGGGVPSATARGTGGGVIEISVRAGDADSAAAYANAYGDTFVTAAATDAVTADLTRRATAPDGPVSPDPVRILLLALAAGLVIGIIGALILDRLRDVIRSTSDLAAESSRAPLLGVLPRHEGPAFAHGAIRDAILASGAQVVQVTAVDASDRSADLAAGLARAVAEKEGVALVDADLRQPGLHRVLYVDGSIGVVDALDGELLEMTLLPLDDGVTFLAAGRPTPTPLKRIGSGEMESLVSQLRHEHPRVIIRSSPAVPHGDAALLTRLVDGVVVVVSIGSSRRQLTAALDALTVVEAPILGLVLDRGVG